MWKLFCQVSRGSLSERIVDGFLCNRLSSTTSFNNSCSYCEALLYKVCLISKMRSYYSSHWSVFNEYIFVAQAHGLQGAVKRAVKLGLVNSRGIRMFAE